MDLELRPITVAEWRPFYDAMEQAFGGDPHDAEASTVQNLVEFERTLAVLDAGRVVATAGAYSFELTVPGAVVPAAGVTAVSVQPTHRRRGLLRRLMHRQLDEVRSAGREPVALLWASEPAIYGRFGYGMAGPVAKLEVATGSAGFARPVPDGGVVRPVDDAEFLAVAPSVYDEQRAAVPGYVRRTPAVWAFRTFDPEHWREGYATLRRVVYERDGRATGYALYRTRSHWNDSRPAGTVMVRELVATDADATAQLWRFLLGIDLMSTVVAHVAPPDDPLWSLLVDVRTNPMVLRDGLWVRVVDVPRALAARRYAVPGRLVLEVSDDFLPEAGGRFLLEGGPDGATCVPTAEPADLVLGVAELGAAYLGGTRLDVLARAGRVEAARAGAAERAAAMFAWSPQPFSPWIF